MTKKIESHGTCEACAKACEDAKDNVKKLQKKLQTMTIVTCVSMTIVGEQAAKSIVSFISTFNDASKAAEGKLPAVSDDAKKEEDKNGKVAIVPFRFQPYRFGLNTNKQQSNYKPEDELARFTKKQPNKEKEQEIQIEVTPQTPVSRAIAQAASTNSVNLIPTVAIPETDWRNVLLTPSTLPFDVYSTTVALGNNYGFGEYYGLGEANSYNPSIQTPSPSSLSVFAIAQLFNSRKRI